mgnify:CR=1 FL=1
MLAFAQLSSTFAVTAPLVTADQFLAAASRGFRTVINFRPDREVANQVESCEMARHAAAAGLHYLHVPAEKHAIFEDDLIDATIQALSAARGPVLATCASGRRAAILWGIVGVGSRTVDDVLADYIRAGFDFRCLREEFEEQAARGRNGAPTFSDQDDEAPEREAA